MADGNSILPSILLGAEYLSEQPADGKLNIIELPGIALLFPPLIPQMRELAMKKAE